MRITVYPDPDKGHRYLITTMRPNPTTGATMVKTTVVPGTSVTPEEALRNAPASVGLPAVLGEPTVLRGGRALQFNVEEVNVS